MRNFRRMPERGLSHSIGPGQGRDVAVPSQYGGTGHAPATMIVLFENGAHMEPLIPAYTPGKDESRVIRSGGNHAGKVHKAGR